MSGSGLVARFTRIDSHDSRESGFARIGNSSDSGASAWRAIKIGVSIVNDSCESIRANHVANRPFCWARAVTISSSFVVFWDTIPTGIALCEKCRCWASKRTFPTGSTGCHNDSWGEALLLAVGAFLLAVKLLCLQSLKALINQARKRHININILVRLRLGRPPVCPWDKPGLSQGQTQVVPGTNRGFLLILHNGSPACPRDKPGLSLGQTSGEWRQIKFMC